MMKSISWNTLMVFSCLLMIFTACGGEVSQAETAKEETKNLDKAEESVSDALNKLGKAIEGLGDEDAAPPVDKEKLKAIFPDDLHGMKRVSREIQKGGMGGIQGIHASAKYKSDDQRLEISVVDGGGLGSSLFEIAGKNFNMEIDKETEHGYERTTKIEGHRALEKYDSKRKRSEITVFADQFMVSINGRGVEMDNVKATLEDMLDELEDLR